MRKVPVGTNTQNGWNEYSKLVLKELTTLSGNIESLKIEMQDIKQEIAKMQVKEDKVEELRLWKERVDDVCSPSQLKDLIIEIDKLKVFKTRAITVFTAVQIAMALLAWGMKMFG